MTATKAKRKSPGGIATNNLVMSAYAGTSDKVFPLVISLYVDPGSVVADVTYGKGVFWKTVPPGLYDLKATDLSTGVDCRELPYADGSLDCVVFDPPFMHSPGGSAHAGHQLFENNYGNNEASFGKNDHGALLDLYFTAADEAFRVLKKGGVYIVKCQDEVCSNTQRLTHVEIINELANKQFVIEDLFVVVRHATPGVSRVLEQLHARKKHSYFLVFLKQKRKKRLICISGKEVTLPTKPPGPQNTLSKAWPRDRDTSLINFFPRFVTKPKIGSLLRAERKAKGKTLTEIADALAVSLNTVWQLEKLNRGSMAGLERISQFLGLEWIGLPPGSSLGARVRTARVRRGWTQEGLANKAGVSRPAVIRVEADRGQISSLCAVLDVIAPDIRPRKPVTRQPLNLRDICLTPPDFVEQVVSVLGGIDLDPCGHPKSFVPATQQFFEEDDGLSQSWKARSVFCNPPYSMATKFMRKAHSEWVSGSAKSIILLISLHACSKIFHEIAGDADMILLKERLRFWSGEPTPMPERAPFSSVVMIFGGNEGVIERARATWGGVFVPKRSTLNRVS
jgi:transcriptional regulator with XRE-family HTH domain